MRLYLFLAALVALVVVTECKHTFVGTNVDKELILHRSIQFAAKLYSKRDELVTFNIPGELAGRTIQGFLAYDNNNSNTKVEMESSAGGIGFSFITLRFTGKIRSTINYDVYIYV